MTNTSAMAIPGTTRFKSRSPSGSATDCRAASVTPGRRILGTRHPAPEPTPRRYRFRIRPCRPRARNPIWRSTNRRCSTSTSIMRCRDSAFRKAAGSAALLAGWTTDGIFHYQSGFPMQTPNSTSTLDSGDVCSSNNRNSFGRIVFRARRSSCIVSITTTLTRTPRSFSTLQRGQTPRPGPTPLQSHTTRISAARDIPANSWALARSSAQGGREILAPRGFLQCL